MIKHHKVETEEDMRTVADLAAIIWKEYYTPIIGEEQVSYMVPRFQSLEAIKGQIERDNYTYYLLSHEGSMAGYIGIQDQGDKLFLSKLYIEETYRNKGLGKEAFRLVEKLGREKGCSKIWLTVNRNNQSSIDIYLKKGFLKVREEKADIGNGFVMDDYIMEKVLG